MTDQLDPRADTSVLSVPCPECGAQRGKGCFETYQRDAMTNDWRIVAPHSERHAAFITRRRSNFPTPPRVIVQSNPMFARSFFLDAWLSPDTAIEPGIEVETQPDDWKEN